ncbi:MAG: hypothetical protein RR957_06360, partial [Oscillospiraceae bacterium]
DPSLASGTPGFIGTNTAELAKYGFKGVGVSYGSNVGNFQAFTNFTGKKQIPFAAKKNTTNTPEQKGEFYFTKDTINAPAPFNKTENGYVYEMEFGSLLRPQSAGDKTGIWEYRLMGLDSEAKEVEIATLQTKINGADIGTATSPEPSYGTASMKGVEGSREVSIPLWFQGQGVSTHVSYFRIYVDLKNQTYTAWLVKRADKNTAYEEKMPEKVDLLVKDVPFTSANKVTQLTGMQGWLTNAYNDPTHFTKVGVSQMNADKVIAEAKRDLTATEILNANSAENNIETDLTLPKVYQNTDVSWVSSATTIISDEGVVAQPINDTSVTMTATFSRGTKTDTRAFNLTVKGVGVIVDDAAKVAADKESLTLGDVSAVTENLTLPAIGLQGCSVTWKSDDTGIISDSGVVTRPEFNTVVTLTATITSNLVSDTKKFDVTVKGTTEVRTLEGVEGTYFAGGEFICETDKTVNFRDLFEGDGSNGTNGTVPWVDPVAGTGGLKAEQTEDGIKFSRTNSDGKNPGRGKAVLEAQYNLPVMENPTSAYYMELSFETSVTPALTFDFGSEGDKGVLQVRKKDDYVGDSAISPTEGPAAYDFKFDGSTKATAPFVAKEPATLGIYVIPQLKKVVVYKNGERVANKVFNYSDSESELLTLKVSWFQSIRWWNIGNEQITLKQCKVFKGDGIPAEE